MRVDGGVRTGGGPMRQLGGVGLSSVERAKWGQNGALLNRYVGAADIPHTSGLPVGYLHPRSWSMPLKPGGMAARLLDGSGSLTAAAQSAFAASASLVGTGTLGGAMVSVFAASATLNGSGSLVVVLTAEASMAAALSGAGALQATAYAAASMSAALQGDGWLDADAFAAASAQAQLVGSGSLTADVYAAAALLAQLLGSGSLTADAQGASAMVAQLLGSGSLVVALSAEASMSAALVGTGTLTADPSSPASMRAILGVVDGGVTPDTIAAAVWAHGTAISLIDAVALIRKISDNRLEVDIAGQRLVLFDDDGVTELREWALETDGGEDVATAPGVQTKRGVPA